MTLPKARTTYANGREARPLDIVQGSIDYAENPKNPFIGQIVRVIPEIGAAKIALVRRPEAMARRLPHFALQNLAATACGLEFRPLAELTLRHRASRPVANALEHGAMSEHTRRQAVPAASREPGMNQARANAKQRARPQAGAGQPKPPS